MHIQPFSLFLVFCFLLYGCNTVTAPKLQTQVEQSFVPNASNTIKQTAGNAFVNKNGMIQIEVGADCKEQTVDTSKALSIEAQKSAVVKYVLQTRSDLPAKTIEELKSNYALFVSQIKKTNSQFANGRLSEEYLVELSIASINKWMSQNGYSRQGNWEIVIMEEIPDLGRIKLDYLLGANEDGNKFFLQRYTTFQRRIRDILLKRMEENGFLINLLEDKEMYSRFKSKNDTLVGVYFDPDNNRFSTNKRLLELVQANNPNTLVLLYRIDSIIYIPKKQRYSISISLSIKDLKTGMTHVVGSYRNTGTISYNNREVVMDELSSGIEKAFDNLIDSEKAADKINDIIVKNFSDRNKEHITLNINASKYDDQNRKKLFYSIRSKMLESGLAIADGIKVSDANMSIDIVSTKCNNVEELYFEHISPLFTIEKIILEDNMVHYGKQSLLINLGDSAGKKHPQSTITKKDALRIAVLYFENNTGSDKYAPLAKGLCDMMINDLIKIPEFEIVERSRIEEVLKELKLNDSNLIDASKSIEIGKLIGAEYLILGSYLEMFDKFRMDTRVVKVETGKICITSGQSGNAMDFEELEQKVIRELVNGLLPDKSPDLNKDVNSTISANLVAKYGAALDMIDKGNADEAKNALKDIISENPKYANAVNALKSLEQ